MALFLTRYPGQCIRIGDNISIIVVAHKNGIVRFAIDAPNETVLRAELLDNIGNLKSNNGDHYD